jgi:hypothetical protein|eukprot:COSAG01_NODE_315_length_19007_cov_18.180135_12_plen_127_part_00
MPPPATYWFIDAWLSGGCCAQLDGAELALLEWRLRCSEEEAAVVAHQHECLMDGAELLLLQRQQAARLSLSDVAAPLHPAEQSLRIAMADLSRCVHACHRSRRVSLTAIVRSVQRRWQSVTRPAKR